MSITELVAIIVALGGFVTALVTARNAASRTTVERMETQADLDKEKRESEAALEEMRREAIRQDFKRLTDEIERQQQSLNNRRVEVEGLWKSMEQMRVDLSQARADLATERSRTTELEAKVKDLLAEREELIAAMKAAGVTPPQRRVGA